MAVHKIKKGLDLPIQGSPEQTVHEAPKVSRVALMNDDSPFMKPRMHVVQGDKVKLGQLLFEDRKTDGVHYTAPAAGEIVAINRGERRKLESLVIKVDAQEEQVTFEHYKGAKPNAVSGEQARALLQESGLWTAFRQRPFSKVPSPQDACRAIFVTATDSNPLAGDPEVIAQGHEADLQTGMSILTKLTEGKVFFCRRPGSKLDPGGSSQIQVEEFSGPHPSGLPGTHIHMLAPVSAKKIAWYIGVQDVIAIGKLFTTGKLWTERVVAVAGPAHKQPRLLRTRLGASLDEITEGQLQEGDVRVVSGSVLAGRSAKGDVFGYLGRYHSQVSCLKEDRERVFLGWLSPGANKFSTARAFVSGLLGMNKKYPMTTTTHGSHRAMVPIGMFERVMPLDVMPTFLLRALLSNDIEHAEKLGALELDEEDLGLCSFVSPGKEDYGKHLRKQLTTIWKEG